MANNNDEFPLRVAIIGAGTIGLSFTALHLRLLPKHPVRIIIYDTRPDIQEYVSATLPGYLDASSPSLEDLYHSGTLLLSSSLESAVAQASVIQEQGPENLEFKQSIWTEIEKHAPQNCLLWSSTSGIPASQQAEHMKDKTRLLVVHPYNPPHLMPLLEIVPSPHTNPTYVAQTMAFWKSRDRNPTLIKKEVPGFVANRLAYALWKEATYLVSEGVIELEDLDDLVTDSMGPRWAIAGPFRSYRVGGGAGGLEGFVRNIGGTVQLVWDDLGAGVDVQTHLAECARLADERYGRVTVEEFAERNRKTEGVFKALGRG